MKSIIFLPTWDNFCLIVTNPGDKVVTIGGIHGKILEVADATVLLNCEGSKIRFAKSAIAQTANDQLEA